MIPGGGDKAFYDTIPKGPNTNAIKDVPTLAQKNAKKREEYINSIDYNDTGGLPRKF